MALSSTQHLQTSASNTAVKFGRLVQAFESGMKGAATEWIIFGFSYLRTTSCAINFPILFLLTILQMAFINEVGFLLIKVIASYFGPASAN